MSASLHDRDHELIIFPASSHQPFLALDHYRRRADPWPFVLGFACGVIVACSAIIGIGRWLG